MEKQNNKPVYEVKIGTLRVAVFRNRTADDRTWYSVAPTRRYYSGQDKTPHFSPTFSSIAELVLLREALTDTISFLKEQQAEDTVAVANDDVSEEE